MPKGQPSGLRCLSAWSELHTQNWKLTCQYSWRTEISQRSGAFGSQLRFSLGAVVIRRRARDLMRAGALLASLNPPADDRARSKYRFTGDPGTSPRRNDRPATGDTYQS